MPSGVRLVEGGNMTVTGEGVKGKEGVGNGTMAGPCDNSAMARTGGEGSKGVNMKSTPTPAEANGEEQAGQGGVAAGGMALLEVDGGEGAVRERRNSIQERRKQRGQAGAGAGAGEVECRVLRLPVVRSESSPMLMLGRSADSSPGSAKSEPPSNQPSPRSPALKVLSKVFSFKDRPSPAWSPKLQRRGDGQGGRTLADARKRSSLHLPPTPPAIHDHEAKWFPDAKSGSPHTNGSPRSPSSPRSPLSPVSPGSKMARLPFFKPTTTASPGKASPGGPNGTMEQLDGAGIIYRPHAYRRAGSTRNHWRTKSDTFTQPPPRVEPVRKRSRDDSECDALPFDLR
ncbi:uncharacterized protein LOC127008289 [Eriocheir sinensis]|uniref:uncharacterized protein LOC127008289 n=1 Tax=Eriocheir sinensis TaxID=95602 RepID=UPI0021CA8347|nr:uncharacterized protein LOC127008289 [Eriocheir sinensis]